MDNGNGPKTCQGWGRPYGLSRPGMWVTGTITQDDDPSAPEVKVFFCPDCAPPGVARALRLIADNMEPGEVWEMDPGWESAHRLSEGDCAR
jgi:hypothetical protein